MWCMQEDGTKESRENYIKTIYILQQEKQRYVHNIEIANRIKVSKPSVSRAISVLKKDGLLVQKKAGEVYLSELGIKYGKEIYERFEFLKTFLIEYAKVDQEIAEMNACKMEHVMEKKAIDGLKRYYDENCDPLRKKCV